MKKIGIFGGAFNPIHQGHIKIAKYAIDFLKLDVLYFVPSYKGPFKKDKDFVSGKDRIKMIELVKLDKMEVSDFEIKRKGISYTVDTIKYFKQKFKNDELYLLIGSDHLAKLSKWKDIEEINKLSNICIFKRSNNINKTNIKKFNCILLNNPIYKEASSDFLKGEFYQVESVVRQYIGKNFLYFEDILRNILSGTRFQHSIHAKNYGILLAKALNYDVKVASFASMVHDIGKEYTKINSLKMIKKYEPNNQNIPEYMYHQEVGYIILKHIFFIDEDIANSIRVHTSLSKNLTLLDKIVFMADKLCQGRKWEGIQKIRKLSLENFDEAFKLVVKRTEEFNLSKNIELTQEQKQIYQLWKK